MVTLCSWKFLPLSVTLETCCSVIGFTKMLSELQIFYFFIFILSSIALVVREKSDRYLNICFGSGIPEKEN